MRFRPGVPPYEEAFTGCKTCKTGALGARWNREEKCGGGCFWHQFDPFAHRMLSLFMRVRECVGKGEADAPIFRVDSEALGLYMAAGSELCEGEEKTDIIDAMRSCAILLSGAVPNGGRDETHTDR